MNSYNALMVFVVACGCAFMVWGSLSYAVPNPHEYKDARKKIAWPLIGAVCLFAYLAWDRQTVIEDTCRALHDAMDFDASGVRHAHTIPFDKAVEVLEASPGFKDAVKVCTSARSSSYSS